MTNPVWKTASNLGTYNNNFLLNTILVASPVPPAVQVSYQVVNGLLPSGITLATNGNLTGILTTTYTNNKFNFSVRATDNLGNFSTRTFTLTINLIPQQPEWNTPVGSIGTYITNSEILFQFDAEAVYPASFINYKLISGSLPTGVSLSSAGLLHGTTPTVAEEESFEFVIRVTDNLQNIRDRSFNISISGTAKPTFVNSSGTILNTLDSTWIYLPIEYNNPISNNEVIISVKQGVLPPGLEITSDGIIRGYAYPPTNSVTLPPIIISVTETSGISNAITCLSTLNLTIGRQVVFSGTTFGGIVDGTSYYIKSIVDSTSFTITKTQNGPTLTLTTASGFMTATLPAVAIGQPTIRTYNFNLELTSLYGNDSANYSITVVNQNTPVSQGGPGYPPNNRSPVIYNNRPPTIIIPPSDIYYGYYLPVNNTNDPSYIGTYQSDNYFAYKIIGHDFDTNPIKYSFSDLPLGLVGDEDTGWISGTPVLAPNTLNQYIFSVAVYKESTPSITSDYINFAVTFANDINGNIIWDTPSSLGTIYNGLISTLFVSAVSDVSLSYRVTEGSLPPHLTLLPNGQITGYVAFQPSDTFKNVGDSTEFVFTIEAYADLFPAIKSSKTFTINVLQQFSQPTDILYMKCTPSLSDRLKIESLLESDIIPEETLYRPNDVYFGKANAVIYEHAYGIYANTLARYLEAVTKNHYWRNITLGNIKTALAKNEAGQVLYEVVYSEIIDNLVQPKWDVVISEFLVPGETYTIVYPGNTDFTKVGAPNSIAGTVFVATGPIEGTGTAASLVSSTSVSQEIQWPFRINLNLGPWYTSSTNIFTSYIEIQDQLYYTSLDPGYANTLYPNSLPNMRNRVGEVLGQEYDSKLLPLWMTSQQANGSTTGYVPAWVICYTKPGFADTVKYRIETLWPYKLNEINFKIDRFSVDKSNTYNYNESFQPPAWTTLPSGTPVPNPLDSKDFYVVFPQETILPNESQQ